jgi:hypothetical protein
LGSKAVDEVLRAGGRVDPSTGGRQRDTRVTARTAPLQESGHAAVTASWHLLGLIMLNMESGGHKPVRSKWSSRYIRRWSCYRK